MNYLTYNPVYASNATTTNLVYTTTFNGMVSQPVVSYRDPLWDLQKRANLEGAAIPENDLSWLKRRVDEISWVPA